MIEGLNVETVNPLDIPPSVSLYGMPGTGKTTEMARAFQNVLYIQSSDSILHAYAHYASIHPEMKLVIPQRITFDENYIRDMSGTAQNPVGSPTQCLINILNRYLAACDSGKNPYEGIVFDEWNVICERVWTELKTDPWNLFKGKSGKFNIFSAMDYFREIHRRVLSIHRRTGKMLGFVSHSQLPRYDEDELSPNRGQLKHRGGPGMPQGLTGSMMELCADADVVLQLEWKAKKDPSALSLLGSLGGLTTAAPAAQVVTPAAAPSPLGGLTSGLGALTTAPAAAPVGAISAPAPAAPVPAESQRVFLTQIDEKWFRKFRGFNVKAEEELDIHQGKGLRELLRRGGYPV